MGGFPGMASGWTGAEERAAWLWQPSSGALLWGNPAAFGLWGVPNLTALQAVRVDRAMPALARLQRLQWALATGGERAETLTLWLAGGARSLDCLCRKVTLAGGEAAFHVEAGLDQDEMDIATARIAAVEAHEAGQAVNGHVTPLWLPPEPARPAAPVLAPEDAQTFNEIGRMLRERTGAGAPTPREDPASEASLAKLAHELRTPLNAIMGYAELLRSEPDGPLGSPKYRAFAGHILESAAHCVELTRGLAARPDATGSPQTADYVEVDVPGTIGTCLGMLAPEATKASIAIKMESDPDLPRAIIDRRALTQIVLNLVGNAIKASPRGATVRVTTTYHPGAGLDVTVTDDGHGMTPDELAAARGLKPNGSGLGLPISRRIANENGAELIVESAPGRGARVALHVPMARLVT